MSALNAVLRLALLAVALLGSPVPGLGADDSKPERDRFLVELLLISFNDLPAFTDLPAVGDRAEAERMLLRAITGGVDAVSSESRPGEPSATPAPDVTERSQSESSIVPDRTAESTILLPAPLRPVPAVAVRANPDAADNPPKSATPGDRLWKALRSHPSANVLAAPRIIVLAGDRATIRTLTHQTFQYLERQGKDTFRLVTTPPKELGVELTVTVVRGEGGVFRLAPLEAKSTTMDGREPIAGVDLDAGPPIINSRSVKIETRVAAGQVRLVPLPSEGRLTAVALRVTEFSEEP